MSDSRAPLALVHDLTSPEPSDRLHAAAVVGDLARDFPGDDVDLLASVLVAARMVETDVECQEAELNSLADLAEWHQLPGEAISRLRLLAPDSLVGSQVEHVAYLLDGRA